MNKKFTFFLLVCLSFSGIIHAQLNGVYTIGGSTPDYATISDALTDAQLGISGPVTFNIRPGTYSGKLFLNDMPGSSSVNTVTIQSENGDSTSVIITDLSSTISSSDFTIFVNGGDYIRMNQLTIERSGSDSYRSVIFMGSNSVNFTVTNCIVQAEAYNFTTLNSCLVRLPVGGALDSLTTFRNNIFLGGSYGLNLSGLSAVSRLKSVVIENNSFTNQGGQSVFLSNCVDAAIRGNNIVTNTTSTQYEGIHVYASLATEIVKNKIVSSTGSEFGVWLDACIGTALNPTNFFNNFIVCGGQFNIAGIEIDGCAYVNIYHNSVNNFSPTPSAGCINISGLGSSNIEILNNIFINSGTGYSFLLSPTPITAISLFDYNDLYVTTNSSIGIFANDTILDIPDLQTNYSIGLNSVSSSAQFISSTDLHSGSAGVNDLGLPLASVLEDIDGELRSGSTPDLGADEFTPLSDNLYVVSLVSPSGGCGDSATMIGVVVRNLGLNTQAPYDIVADVVFPGGNQIITETTLNSLPSNGIDTFYFAQTLNTYGGGVLDLTVYTNLALDQYRLNDTIRATFTYLDHPNAPTVVTPQDQCDNNLAITATADSGDVLMWYAEATSTDLLFSGSVFSPTVSADTTFYVETRHGSGNAGCLRISEIEPNGGGDYVELQNVSGIGFDATGYKVVASDDYTDINLVNSVTWDLDYFAPGEIKFKTDNGSDPNYWGSNLLIEPGFPGWLMIIDPLGNIVDFVALQWDSATIQTLLVNINGVDISVGSEWSGDGTPSTCNNFGDTPSRIGNSDNNSAVDWTCDLASAGTQNPSLATSFLSCGVGACASPRFAIDIHLIAGIQASLGADTAAQLPFTIPLSPGAGYTTYLWSTNETTDTIFVTAPGTYWVTVSGPNGCTITDSITVGLSVDVNGQLSNDVLSFFPNPATDQLTIKSGMIDLNNARIRMFNSQGSMITNLSLTQTSTRSYVLDLKNYESGIYFVQVITDKGMRVERLSVVK